MRFVSVIAAGALLLGTMLADHRRSQELTNVLWGLKELFLVGFFLNIGFSGPPTLGALTNAVLLVALLPIKGAIFFLLLIGLGLRARTSFLTAVSLMTYSEFALIVVALGVENGLLGSEWVIVTALAVSQSSAASTSETDTKPTSCPVDTRRNAPSPETPTTLSSAP